MSLDNASNHTSKPSPLLQRLTLWQQILIALVLGITLGILFGHDTANSDIGWLRAIHPYGALFIVDFFKPVGDLFVNAIKMIVVPVVFVSIVCGVISIANPSTMGRMGLKTMGIFVISMAFASLVGIMFAKISNPGMSIPEDKKLAVISSIQHDGPVIEQPTIVETITSIIPANPVEAMASSNILQIVVFAFLLGIAINCAGERGKPIANLFNSLAAVIQHIPRLVMRFAPLGVFALMMTVAANFGLTILRDLLISVGTIYAGCIIFAIVFYSIVLHFYAGLSPWHFFRGMAEAMTFAYSTTSSSATMPYTAHCTHNNLGVSKRITDFVIPLGATVNMNGLAVYLAVSTIFAVNLYGIELGTTQYLLLIITGTLGAIGAAGVPGSGLVVMSMAMSSVGLNPGQIAVVIALFAGVDRLIDMMTTTINITGDAFTAVLVAKTEKELDKKVYDAPPIAYAKQLVND